MAHDEPAPPDPFLRLLDRQLEMNPRTWAALEQRGVTSQTLIVIDFYFTAPSKDAAKYLVRILRQRTSFACEVHPEGPRLKRTWRVIGQTKPSTASVQMLNDWVTFMVTLGAKNGESRFDGWGVKVPEAQAGTAPTVAEELGQSFTVKQGQNGHSANGSQ
ncbi:MAG TPA: ribonuclease E inhibitor RraB [Solirubrobacteraceae bacterium]|nr:ribonuclease E inhibitor RraB [Solirubrobacteraceae bacterium]